MVPELLKGTHLYVNKSPEPCRWYHEDAKSCTTLYVYSLSPPPSLTLITAIIRALRGGPTQINGFQQQT